ncbi:hypothetical protein V6N13_146795 [Hibiscus sabdariffa]
MVPHLSKGSKQQPSSQIPYKQPVTSPRRLIGNQKAETRQQHLRLGRGKYYAPANQEEASHNTWKTQIRIRTSYLRHFV